MVIVLKFSKLYGFYCFEFCIFCGVNLLSNREWGGIFYNWKV